MKYIHKKTEEDLLFMNPIDAAYHRKPRFGFRLLSIGTILGFLALLVWANYTEIDEISHATGQVIPSKGIQSIEHLEGGTLKEVLVQEGDTVEQGSVLARISNEVSQAEYYSALEKSYTLQASICRFQAQLNNTDIVFSTELQNHAPELIKNEKQVFESQKKQNESELAVLQSEYLLKTQELESLKHKEKSMQDSLFLNQQHLNRLNTLRKENLASKVDVLKQQEAVIDQQAEITHLFDNIKSLEIEIQLAKEKYTLKLAEIENKIAQELSEAQSDLSTLNQTILLGSSRNKRTEITSPVRGKVKRIFINTIGAVIRPAVPIMEIVPLDDTLLIEAKISPSDIGFIQQKQKAIIKISAYDFSIFGGLEGYVEHISADTIEDKQGNVYYLANIRTKQNFLLYKDKKLEIIPGMITEVDILTGKKSVLSFILKPIMKTKENAFTQR